ncbi:MAG: 16S rRNA (uracil(1498)-N(3))-methyltransferase [Bacteroidota bacterium]|nr:16S rRNA (uracil(1498)-N(3))-methyltransferase [Bacteroidota bacterium]
MPLSFFYEENLSESNQFFLREESSRHIVQVLRMLEGEQILITNGKGHTLTVEIIFAHKKKTEVKLIHKEFSQQRVPKISIAISLIKNANRFEWFLEKSTEIGVSEIIPLLCKRTEKTHFREDRMKTILVSAMLQSRQAWLPALSAPVTINELIKKEGYGQKFIAHCMDKEKKILNNLIIDHSSSKIILIGPEGDFTEEEIDEAIQHNFIPLTLGETRLRTETAGIVAAVLLTNKR